MDTAEELMFGGKSLSGILEEIRSVYLSDNRPWVLGYSGGKDSTTALQLVWNALAMLPLESRKKPVHVISSDTLVETPIISDYINETLRMINETATKQGLPIHAEKVRPQIRQSFWVNLIGRGYPAPQGKFRWCTDRLKIQPADIFIRDKVSKYGEIVLVLGVRRSESATRSQVMSLYNIKGTILSRHSSFSGAFVYTPIKDFSLDDVWNYLLTQPSPWGSDNKELAILYRHATGECPLVVDDTTPSCGNSRFGCWVCTVVTRDKSMESLISSGEKWMKPLLEIRDFLASTQDPRNKHIYRDYKRRQGFVSFKSKNPSEISRGPYRLEICKEVLRRVLIAENEISTANPERHIQLISPEELNEIRRIWRTERGDWEDSVPRIYRETTNSDLGWVTDDFGSFTKKESMILDEVCNKNGVPMPLVTKLLDAEIQTQGMRRRSSIFNRIDQILGEEWRTEEEVLRSIAVNDTKTKNSNRESKIP